MNLQALEGGPGDLTTGPYADNFVGYRMSGTRSRAENRAMTSNRKYTCTL